MTDNMPIASSSEGPSTPTGPNSAQLRDPSKRPATSQEQFGDQAGLRRMKLLASGLFVVVTIGFIVARLLERNHSWIGYVRAMFEAAMVGAIADWFAVTALFRRPLGLPIPHTAIVAERKNEIGRGLGEFVQQNFLTADVLGAKIRSAKPTDRAVAWAQLPGNDLRIVRWIQRAAGMVLERLDDAEVERFLASQLRARAEAIPAAPTAARAIRALSESGRRDSALDAILQSAHRLIWDHRDTLALQFVTKSPWWVPGSVDARVFDRLFLGATTILHDMRADHAHPLRISLLNSVDEYVKRLENDQEYLVRGEAIKQQLLDHPQVTELVTAAWASGKAQLHDQLGSESTPFGLRLQKAIGVHLQQLAEEPQRRDVLDAQVEKFVTQIVDNYGHEVAGLITSTVERWDTDDTVARIEGNIGRDLQFIRINGTVVGGLAGLAIYTLSRFF